jgi:hypothetical protein
VAAEKAHEWVYEPYDFSPNSVHHSRSGTEMAGTKSARERHRIEHRQRQRPSPSLNCADGREEQLHGGHDNNTGCSERVVYPYHDGAMLGSSLRGAPDGDRRHGSGRGRGVPGILSGHHPPVEDRSGRRRQPGADDPNLSSGGPLIRGPCLTIPAGTPK